MPSTRATASRMERSSSPSGGASGAGTKKTMTSSVCSPPTRVGLATAYDGSTPGTCSTTASISCG